MSTIWQKILNFILPPRCICCGEVVSDENGLCANCFNKIRFISKPYCKICGVPFENDIATDTVLCAKCLKEKRKYFTMQRSAFIYDDNSKNILLALKFMDKTGN